ncbi:hypothetical protein [Clostridium luticellarii]|jgi:hypothetical protein|uniref:Uncharacterized protein n=1 Tax=Clostridium luticellarii TaxID=1691940 RepID=A0A2T0BN17_9CLOT|nr:hypothetical protein [Clostridium luticellarii]PRR85243.1 hypothetical protein CLLU_17990 [Clostridium luticellarii]
MEFKLNKIDPEVRRRVKETTSADKVHNKRKIFIDSNNKDKGKKEQGNFERELSKYKEGKSRKKIVVQATRVKEVKVDAFREEKNSTSKVDNMGSIIDVKK